MSQGRRRCASGRRRGGRDCPVRSGRAGPAPEAGSAGCRTGRPRTRRSVLRAGGSPSGTAPTRPAGESAVRARSWPHSLCNVSASGTNSTATATAPRATNSTATRPGRTSACATKKVSRLSGVVPSNPGVPRVLRAISGVAVPKEGRGHHRPAVGPMRRGTPPATGGERGPVLRCEKACGGYGRRLAAELPEPADGLRASSSGGCT